MALNIKVGDILRMKKAHPCGNSLWQVGRLGADIGVTCQKCGRYVLLSRSYLERRVKEVVPRVDHGQDKAFEHLDGHESGPTI